MHHYFQLLWSNFVIYEDTHMKMTSKTNYRINMKYLFCFIIYYMKTIAIHVDIRKSKLLSIKQKEKFYTDLYSKMNKFSNQKYNNISFRNQLNVGDGVILVFNADTLGNNEEVIKLLKQVDSKVDRLEENNNVKYGVGVSYGIALDNGQGNIISFSIDGASTGANLGNKYKIADEFRRWVLPLKTADDEKGSIEELTKIIETSSSIWSKRSYSGKNLWFNFTDNNI